MFPNSVFAHAVGSFRTPVQPPDSDPDSGSLSTVSINCEWLPFIRGALTQMLLQSTWKIDIVSLETTQKRAWRLINMFAEMECEMCDCITYVAGVPNKFVPDGHGGGSFLPIDPRTEGTVPAPWITPPSGQTGQCLSAKNISAFFGNSMGYIAEILGISATLSAMLIAFTDFMGLVIPVWGEVLALVADMAVGAVGAGATVFGAAFNTTTQTAAYDGITCLFQCHAGSDGRLDAAGIEAIKTEFYASIDSWVANPAENALWRLMFPDFVDGQGPNGLTLLGNIERIDSADCSGCDCGWCENFNFTLDSYGWVPWTDGSNVYAEYVAGIGFRPHASHPQSCIIKRQFSPDLVCEKIDFSYIYLGGCSVHEGEIYFHEDASGGPLTSGTLAFGSGNMEWDGTTTGFDWLVVDTDTSFDCSDAVGINAVRLRGHGTPPGAGVSC